MFRERFVDVTAPYRLWTQECGDPTAEALLLVMGRQRIGMAWPDTFVRRLVVEAPGDPTAPPPA